MRFLPWEVNSRLSRTELRMSAKTDWAMVLAAIGGRTHFGGKEVQGRLFVKVWIYSERKRTLGAGDPVSSISSKAIFWKEEASESVQGLLCCFLGGARNWITVTMVRRAFQ
eukprot:TRINITY_DN8059_c0_g3_i3.p4 TRINITY_DN8059_c0_g3~~TRINITY_DN8059_c0_g3_i3.p4  ORF type:complete len:111 (+),score=11.21 TRINITY_DN8059_c0_g3_i3:1800-2132(+)